jgi:hypothetical protein
MTIKNVNAAMESRIKYDSNTSISCLYINDWTYLCYKFEHTHTRNRTTKHHNCNRIGVSNYNKEC